MRSGEVTRIHSATTGRRSGHECGDFGLAKRKLNVITLSGTGRELAGVCALASLTMNSAASAAPTRKTQRDVKPKSKIFIGTVAWPHQPQKSGDFHSKATGSY